MLPPASLQTANQKKPLPELGGGEQAGAAGREGSEASPSSSEAPANTAAPLSEQATSVSTDSTETGGPIFLHVQQPPPWLVCCVPTDKKHPPNGLQ